MNKYRRIGARCRFALCFAALALLASARAQWNTQTLVLSPGWNAVYLSVAPTPSDCDALFGANARILSVRRWAPPPIETYQFDQATGTSLPQAGSWLTWFPSSHPDRFLMTLSETAGSAAYLIEVSDGPAVALNIVGRPLALEYAWKPSDTHFIGLPVYSAAVSFNTFFSPAGSNILTDYRIGGEIYTVLSNGVHQRIFTPLTSLIKPGAAYWVKAQQYSTYGGPVTLQVDSPAGWLDFGRKLLPQYIEIKNLSGSARGVKLAHLNSDAAPAGTPPLAGAVPLKYAIVVGGEEAMGRVWTTLPATWTTQLTSGASVRLAFIPDVAALGSGNTNNAYQSVLEVTDDSGQTGIIRQRVGVRAMARTGSAAESRGLWVGEVNITDVGRLEMPGVFGIPTTPKPVSRPFNFRVLAHVDGTGTARLLQRVFVGTRKDPVNGGVITDLMATETRVSQYKAQYPDGKVMRLSSANFPFMAPAALTNGGFGVPDQAVRCVVNISRTDTSNPFLHAFAPLHDNKERRAEDDIPYAEDVEVFSVRREIEMVFQGPDQVNPDPRLGETVCGGVYRENIYGLGGTLDATNRTISVMGRFVMQRASTVTTLLQ